MAKTKLISLADMLTNFEKSEAGQQLLEDMNARREKSPAKFARQFDFELISLCLEMSGRIKIIANLQDLLTPAEGYNANDLTDVQTDEIFKRRTEEIYALHVAQVKYDSRKKELDAAVAAEEK